MLSIKSHLNFWGEKHPSACNDKTSSKIFFLPFTYIDLPYKTIPIKTFLVKDYGLDVLFKYQLSFLVLDEWYVQH